MKTTDFATEIDGNRQKHVKITKMATRIDENRRESTEIDRHCEKESFGMIFV